MNKIFGIFLLSAIFLVGCVGKKDSESNLSESELTTEASISATDILDIDEETQPIEAETTPRVIEYNITPAVGTYIYDNAKVLSAEEFSECNDYLEWLYETFMLNVAVVTTDKVDGEEPSNYAMGCYNEIYDGKGSGIILLINNDTNEDYIYKHGRAVNYISEQAEGEAFFYATKSIMDSDFKTGIITLLKLVETAPMYVFDNGSMFTADQIIEIENTLATKKNSCIMTTVNITDKTNEELAMEFYNRHYPDKKGSMLFMDKQSDLAIIIDNGQISSDTSLTQINAEMKSKSYFKAYQLYTNN